MKKYRPRDPERDARPLTPDEAIFAEEHFGIVWWYLKQRQLDPSEWYDVIVIRYLQTVKLWHSDSVLRDKYTFTTIVVNAMRSAVGNEYAKQRRRPRTVSIHAKLSGTDLTLEQVLSA